jgi:FAD/FMN-containing dehydrogenase
MVNNDVVNELKDLLGAEHVTDDQPTLTSASKDCYYFSPVLIPQLDGKIADVIVKPKTKAQLKAIIQLAVKHNIPVTPRGGGTGNYGQGVPMKGGIMINTKRMKQILAIDSSHAHVESGVNLGQLEKAARQHGGELRMFPSTIATSSAAGFITGGSGGVGSISTGLLAEPGNILSATIMTIEAEPKELLLDTPEKLKLVLHNCGLTAFVTEIDFALSPRTEWHQYILSYDTIEAAIHAGETLAYDESLHKRLCSVMEWPIPSYFKPLVKRNACPEGKSAVFLTTDLTPDELAPYIDPLSSSISFHQTPIEEGKSGFEIYNFTWNHTTLWAMKHDPSLTYLQEMYDRDRLYEQYKLIKDKFGDQVSLHIEFLKSGGVISPGGLSIINFQNKQQLWQIIEFCNSIGVRISNPHSHYLDDDVRWFNDEFSGAKQQWDPHQLLNPGHFKALEGIA